MISRILRTTLIAVVLSTISLLVCNRFYPELVTQHLFNGDPAKPNPLTLLVNRISGQTQDNQHSVNGDSQASDIAFDGFDSNVAQQSNNQALPVEKQMYRWVDDKGRAHFSETEPQDKSFEVMTYQKEVNPNPAKSTRNLPIPFSGLSGSGVSEQSQSANQEAEEEQSIDVPIQCRGKLSQLESYENKLSKSNNVVDSIWLQDYCSALSDLILEGCVIPKEQVKYNSYCPMRYKR